MFSKILDKKLPDNMINGCKVVKRSKDTMEFPFCSDVIYLDERNQMGIEFRWDRCIRIDGLITTDGESFVQMMDALAEIARRFDYNRFFFADKLSDYVLEMFLSYGFSETQVLGDPFNHYLDLYLFTEKEGVEDEPQD